MGFLGCELNAQQREFVFLFGKLAVMKTRMFLIRGGKNTWGIVLCDYTPILYYFISYQFYTLKRSLLSSWPRLYPVYRLNMSSHFTLSSSQVNQWRKSYPELCQFVFCSDLLILHVIVRAKAISVYLSMDKCWPWELHLLENFMPLMVNSALKDDH